MPLTCLRDIWMIIPSGHNISVVGKQQNQTAQNSALFDFKRIIPEEILTEIQFHKIFSQSYFTLITLTGLSDQIAAGIFSGRIVN